MEFWPIVDILNGLRPYLCSKRNVLGFYKQGTHRRPGDELLLGIESSSFLFGLSDSALHTIVCPGNETYPYFISWNANLERYISFSSWRSLILLKAFSLYKLIWLHGDPWAKYPSLQSFKFHYHRWAGSLCLSIQLENKRSQSSYQR